MKAHKLFPSILFFFIQLNMPGQIMEYLSIDLPTTQFHSDHLELGGSNSDGRTIDVNNYFISIDGKPTIPVTGEFHYSRYPEEYWEESIQKMRAGGISMIATYVFWNIHEEREGVFDWEGSKDLRKFVKLCAQNNYDVIVRIGPFCHGEIRNGGLPDWLLGKPLSIRSNDAGYLSYVERLYREIGLQLDGLYFKDGGPVIGIQLENEYQHSAAPWGLTYPGQPHDWTAAERDLAVTQIGVGVADGENPYAELGNEHMKVLKGIAQKAGIEVPIYTATGWGNAAIVENETLPVTAAYPYPTWAPEVPSDFYLYTELQKDPDYAPTRYCAEDYPYFAAEIGGGIMHTYSRRPVVPPESMDPLINRFLGSGANGIGYYMYHGGSTPRGEREYFSDVAIGCPIISYDFKAPIGEFGQVKPSYHRLKPLHFFLKYFGDLLAPMQVVLPDSQKQLTSRDNTTLRYSVRTSEGSGFIFMNNFQDHLTTLTKENIQFTFMTGSDEIVIPEKGGLTLLADEHAILPFNIQMGGILLNYATTQLYAKGGEPGNEYFVFFIIPGIEPEYSIARSGDLKIQHGKLRIQPGNDSEVIRNKMRFLVRCNSAEPSEFVMHTEGGNRIRILTVPREMAMNSYMVNIGGKEHLLFSKALVLGTENKLDLISFNRKNFNISIYPAIEYIPQLDLGNISSLHHDDAVFKSFEVDLPGYHSDVMLEQIQNRKFAVVIPGQIPDQVNDLFLVLDYFGDTGMGFLDGDLVADHFYDGTTWSIGLKKFNGFAESEEMVFYFRPLYKDALFLNDLKSAGLLEPDDVERGFELKNVQILPEYKVSLSF